MTISDAIRYVGVNDTDIDLFESQYPVPHGVSYNSYLLLDDKIALLDTVDKRKYDDWAAKVDAVLDGRTPDYIVVHHLEPDHAGSLQMTIEKYPEATLVLSAKALAMLPQFFDLPAGTKTLSVKEGDTLELGHHTLTFVMAPMVHWPEVMVSYEQTDIATICPLHGPVLQGDLAPYLHLYNTWSSYQPEARGVFIAYASIYGNTKAAALLLAEELKSRGVTVEIADLSRTDLAQAVAKAFQYSQMVCVPGNGRLLAPLKEQELPKPHRGLD